MITAPRARDLFDLSELWIHREVLFLLAWRDLRVRYKQTAIGVSWALLQPLAMMIVFTIFFGKLARFPTHGVPYPVFILAALVPWNLFARVLASASDSILRDQRLITKVYFPRMIIPLAASVVGLVDYGISLALLLFLMVVFRVPVHPSLVLVIPLTCWVLVISTGVGLFLSALNVQFRDIQHFLPFLTQIWFFLTPIVYPASLVPAHWQWVFAINPMVYVVEAFRFAIVGSAAPGPSLGAISLLTSVIVICLGIVTFRLREPGFADHVG